MTQAAGNGVGKIEALDGVRGLAVLMVIGLHLDLLGFGGAGVLLFFVLSGFLITRILVHDRQVRGLPLGEFLKRFYMRRALRIWPLMYGYLALVAAALVIGHSRNPWLHHELRWGLAYLLNFDMAIGWGPAPYPAIGVLGHFWSLCVEEHFYLFWPLVVFALSRRALMWTAGLLLLAGPVLRLAAAAWLEPGGHGTTASMVAMLTTSNLDGFAAGALASLLPPARTSARGWAAIFAVLLGLVYGAGVIAHGNFGLLPEGRFPLTFGYPPGLPDHFQFVWGYSALDLLFAGLILAAMQVPALGRAFSSGWLRYTGRISYGMYVFHVPILTLLHRLPAQLPRPLLVATLVGATYAAAALSFRFFETPFLRLKQRWASDAAPAPRGGALDPA